ncbi:hypothetical protein [Pseudogemmobacter sonorensis]|uniref:hypothetical protein n=1 Tax=Pseudogemmobacter sonorensis TaxID=2989681 RepID=UPI003679F2F8
MKVDVTCILIDQWRTLGGSLLGWISDAFFFLVIPTLLAVLASRAGVTYSNEVYGYALTVFSIFSALLITAQIAIFGMFQKHADKLKEISASEGKPGSIAAVRAAKTTDRRKDNLKQLNSNISYLTLLSCVCATTVLAFLAFSLNGTLETVVSTFLYSHFAVSLAMVLKRFHIVFDDEYQQNS